MFEVLSDDKKLEIMAEAMPLWGYLRSLGMLDVNNGRIHLLRSKFQRYFPDVECDKNGYLIAKYAGVEFYAVDVNNV